MTFLDVTAKALRREKFGLVDIGCSGGIDPVWRAFGDRLSAIGFDISTEEVRRLTEVESHPGIRYVAGRVDLPADHPFARRSHNVSVENLYARFSARWAQEIEADRLAAAPHAERMRKNLWKTTELAETAIDAPAFLQDAGMGDIDLLKIDVDGADLRILHGFGGLFERFGILAARLEVCLFGRADDTQNTFHNTDRFMREQGYSLFRLDNRTYSTRALPARFECDILAQTIGGRVFQAEAHYARDPVSDDGRAIAETLSDEKLLKLAAIFSAWGLPDSAAELLVTFRSRFVDLIDVDRALDVLAAQAQPDALQPLSYGEYVASFAADPTAFCPQPIKPPNLRERLRAAWVALTDLPYIDKLRRC